MSDVIVIGGPTASGKSGLAADLAQACKGTVINADSLQVYDGLPILTAQPQDPDLLKAPHRLYGFQPPGQPVSAASWRKEALTEIEKSLAQNSLPVVVGGTGLYLRALTEGLSPIPSVPAEIRAATVQQHTELGNSAFHALLSQLDPAMGARLAPGDTQRTIRAMEVFKTTGKSLAFWQSLPPEPPPADLRFVRIVLMPDREELYSACDLRFDAMITAGALEEAAQIRERILKGSLAAKAPVTRAIGYHELAAYLDGKMTLPEARTRACQLTRNYAKRQRTWFKHQFKADLVLKDSCIDPILDLLHTLN